MKVLTDREDELTSEVEHGSPVLRKRPSREASQEHQRESPRPHLAHSSPIHLSSSQNHLNGSTNNPISGSHLHISNSQTYLTSPQNSMASPHNSATSPHNSTTSTHNSFASPQNPTIPHNPQTFYPQHQQQQQQATCLQNERPENNQREISITNQWSKPESTKYPMTSTYSHSNSPDEGERETKFSSGEARGAPPPTAPRSRLQRGTTINTPPTPSRAPSISSRTPSLSSGNPSLSFGGSLTGVQPRLPPPVPARRNPPNTSNAL